MAKLSLDQKRLEALRRQLYGKSHQDSPSKKQAPGQASPKLSSGFSLNKYNNVDSPKAEAHINSVASVDASFLRKDLIRILILTSIALCAQLLLYFASNNRILNLHF